MSRFRAERPEWGDIPDELVEKSTTFALWSFLDESRRLMSEVGDALRELGRKFR